VTRPPIERVGVVGGGVGGLCAAIHLKALAPRLHVDVFEARGQWGGKLGWAEAGGLVFDTGPSVLTLPHVIDEVLERAGLDPRAALPLRRPDPFFEYVFSSGVRLRIFHEWARTLEEIEHVLGAAARREAEGFLAYARRIWTAAAPAFVYDRAPSVGRIAWLGPAVWRSFLQIDALRSMHAAIVAQVRTPELRDLFLRYATYNGSDPRRAPATLNTIADVELVQGGYAVEGGMYRIVEALTRAAEGLGIRLHLGAAVRRIERNARGEVAGLAFHDRDAWRGEAIVANADWSLVSDTLLGEPEAASRLEPSTSGWVGVLKVRGDRAPHAVVFPQGDYLQEFGDLFDARVPPRQPTVYLCAQSTCHGRARTAAGEEALFVMCNTPALRDARYTAADLEPLRRHVLERLVALGLVDDEARGGGFLYERTPQALAEEFPGSFGAIYGHASNDMWAAFRRPANRVSTVPGLYLASGSAHPGGGVPLCALSGREAAYQLLETQVGWTGADLARRHW
jgi:phytoene desaturase